MQWPIFKCIIVRACMNWEIKLTLYEISLCVSVRYCKSPSLKKDMDLLVKCHLLRS